MRRIACSALLVAILSGIAVAAPPQGTALPTTTVVCDGISTGAIQLQTVSVTYLYSQSTRARIKGSANEYVLVPHVGTADGVNLVDASDGRQWQLVASGGVGGGGGTPPAHAATHEAGGSDPIPLDSLAAPSDVTTLNASTTAHGLAPKRSGSATDCLLGNGTYAACLSGISIGAGTFLGNNGGSAGAPLALTPAQARALLQIGAADIVDSPAFGQSIVKAGSASAVLLLLGTGSAALQPTSAFDAAGAAAAAQAASQPLNASLTAVGALTLAANKCLTVNASNNWAFAPCTTFGLSLAGAADAVAGRIALGLGSAALSATADFDAAGAASAAQAASQPLDSDLTSIAALSTTSFGRGLLALLDAAALRTAAALGTLATQSGTFSGTSSGTNTGDQTLSGLGGVAKAGDSMTGPLATSKDFRYGSSPGQPSASLGGASPVMVDWTAGAIQEKVLSANVTGAPTFTAPATTPAFGFVRLAFRLKQAASGGPYTVAAWPSNAKWENGQVPVVPTAAGAYIWISCVYDGTTYDCSWASTYSMLDPDWLTPANDIEYAQDVCDDRRRAA